MKAIYFEYPSEYNEFFEKLSNKLHEINITDNKKYWCRPFQDITYIKDNNKKMTKLRISLSPIISEYAIANEKEKEKMDLQIEEMWQELLNEDEIIEEDKKIEKIQKIQKIQQRTDTGLFGSMVNDEIKVAEAINKQANYLSDIVSTINEIIDKLNEMEKE